MMAKQQENRENSNQTKVPHNLVMENRRTLSITAVKDVTMFEETRIVLDTAMGELTITGEGLHLNNLSVDTGEISIEGKVDSMSYDDDPISKQSLWARLFR